MIKIRDGVDLKELEKFGFKLNNLYGWRYEYKNSDDLIPSLHSDYMKPYEDINVITFADGELYIHANTHMVKIPDKIYDLIKADLVEKVGD